MPSHRAWILAAAIVAGCKGNQKKASSNGDAGVPGYSLEIKWYDALEGAARIVSTPHVIAAEWYPFDAPEPAPRELAAIDVLSGEILAKDHGWIARGGETANDVLVVDEADRELSYVARHLGGSDDLPLPPPGEGDWALRSTVCGRSSELCAVVRWSPSSERGDTPKVERLGITVLRPQPLAVEGQYILEVPGVLADTVTFGGVEANPSTDEIYVIEAVDGTSDAVAVRAFDLATGATRWRSPVRAVNIARQPSKAQVIASGDGKFVIVVQGEWQHGYRRVERLTVLDAGSGAILGSTDKADLDAAFDMGALLFTRPDSPGVLFARVTSERWADSRTYKFRGLHSFDPKSKQVRQVYKASDSEMHPKRATMSDAKTVIGVSESTANVTPRDDTSEEQQRARAARIAAMLAP